jgi:hypothetical protein
MDVAGCLGIEEADASCGADGLGTVACGLCAIAGETAFNSKDKQQSDAAIRTIGEAKSFVELFCADCLLF